MSRDSSLNILPLHHRSIQKPLGAVLKSCSITELVVELLARELIPSRVIDDIPTSSRVIEIKEEEEVVNK